MRRTRLWLVMAAGILVVGGVGAAVMLVPWSRSCETEQARAETAWRRYAESETAERRPGALEVLRTIPRDVGAALCRADVLGPPASVSGRYREAMETLSLAESACRESR